MELEQYNKAIKIYNKISEAKWSLAQQDFEVQSNSNYVVRLCCDDGDDEDIVFNVQGTLISKLRFYAEKLLREELKELEQQFKDL